MIVTRVHPEFLDRQQLPDEDRSSNFWKGRFESINSFEEHLYNSGTLVLKFFLHISKEEQRRRFLKRLEEPRSGGSSRPPIERARALGRLRVGVRGCVCTHEHLALTVVVVPADHKWFTRLAVAEIICDALDALDLKFPTVPKSSREAWAEAKAKLEAETNK